jgi:hypothetical protein
VAGEAGGGSAAVMAFAMAADRKTALVAKPQRLSVVDLEANRALSSWSGTGNVVAASADGRMFAAGGFQPPGSSIDLKVVRGPGHSSVFPGHPKQFLRSLAFSPSGRLLASSAMQGLEAERNAGPALADRVLRVWNVDWKDSGEPQEANWPLPKLLESPAPRDRIDLDAVRFSPGGRWLAAVGDVMHYASDGSLKEVEDIGFLWDVQNKTVVRRLDRVATHATTAVFSPDEKLLVTGHAGTNVETCVLRVWDVETGRVLREMRGHDRPIFSLDVSPDGALVASVDAKGWLRVWRLADGQVVGQLEGVESNNMDEVNRTAPRLAAAFLADSRSLVTAGREGVRLWALAGGDAKPQAKSEAAPELDELVRLAEENLERVQKQYEAGVAPFAECLEAGIAALEAKLHRATALGDPAEAVKLLERMVELREMYVENVQSQFEAGALPASKVNEAQKKLIEAKLRLKEEKGKAAPNNSDSAEAPDAPTNEELKDLWGSFDAVALVVTLPDVLNKFQAELRGKVEEVIDNTEDLSVEPDSPVILHIAYQLELPKERAAHNYSFAVEVHLTWEKNGQAIELWKHKSEKHASLTNVVDEMRDESARLVREMLNERKKALGPM